MARVQLRTAAAAGLIAGLMTVANPVVPAFADPGGSHSRHDRAGHESRHDRDGNSRGGKDRHGPRKGSGEGRNGHGSDGPGSKSDGPGSNADGPGSNDDGHPSGGTPEWIDEESSAGRDTAARPPSTVPSTARVATAQAADEAPIDVPTTPAPEAGGGGGGGGAPAAEVTPIATPRVVFGNGRTPGVSSGRADAAVDAAVDEGVALPQGPIVAVPTPELTAPALPVVPSAPQPKPVPDVSTGLRAPLVGAQIWMPDGPGRDDGTLFGIAGLVLLPLAGVWLGYRQASAAKAAELLAVR